VIELNPGMPLARQCLAYLKRRKARHRLANWSPPPCHKRYPDLIGHGLLELPVQHIRRDSQTLLAVGCVNKLTPPKRAQAIEPYQSSYPVPAHGLAALGHGGAQSAATVGLAAGGKGGCAGRAVFISNLRPAVIQVALCDFCGRMYVNKDLRKLLTVR
jgi:hypothetical protein